MWMLVAIVAGFLSFLCAVLARSGRSWARAAVGLAVLWAVASAQALRALDVAMRAHIEQARAQDAALGDCDRIPDLGARQSCLERVLRDR